MKGGGSMSYEPLYKVYYKYPEKWQEILNTRYMSENTEHIGISIAQINRRKSFSAFFVYHKDILDVMIKIERKHSAFLELLKEVPLIMHPYLLNTFLVEEIKASNDIEGVHSSRREIQEAIGTNVTEIKRFSSVVSKYRDILNPTGKKEFYLNEEIRSLYDALVSNEIEEKNKLDGKIFRKDSVSVYDGFDREIHVGTTPESEIIRLMNIALGFLNNNEIQLSIRVAVFHYIFGYIHPFYDGNGRINRYMSSSYLAKEFHPLVALRLSALIKANRSKYYKIFSKTTSEYNGGDLTPFIIQFLNFLVDTIDNLHDLLNTRLERLRNACNQLDHFFINQGITDEVVQNIYYILLQTSLFMIGPGITREELWKNLEKSKKTVYERIKHIPREHLKIQKVGKIEYFKLKKSILGSIQ